MRINKTKTDCCGCTACENICPHKAIVMQPDSLGFLYPKIDDSLCVDCGLCEKICSFHTDYDKSLNLLNPVAYAVRHKDLQEIQTSQSGAAFVAFSDWILNKGGVVYGVGYIGHFRVVHKKATTKVERNEFKGSKYVQSNLNSVFSQVEEDLKKGLIVLFSGTPCQTSGLRSYIKKSLQGNLFLVDVVCHGVAAPFVWEDYLNFLEKREGQRLVKTNFRDKSFGWRSQVESFLFSNGKKKTYSFTFYTTMTIRQSCMECPYTNLKRPSDITVADFWGIEKTKAVSMGIDNRGCSLVLLNTEKGRCWFEQVKNKMEYQEVSLRDCMQPQLSYPTELHPKRLEFEYLYTNKGFSYVLKYYGFIGWKHFVKRIMPKSIKVVIRRIVK